MREARRSSVYRYGGFAADVCVCSGYAASSRDGVKRYRTTGCYACVICARQCGLDIEHAFYGDTQGSVSIMCYGMLCGSKRNGAATASVDI